MLFIKELTEEENFRKYAILSSSSRGNVVIAYCYHKKGIR